MKRIVFAVLALAVAGCGGRPAHVAAPPGDEAEWESIVHPTGVVEDAAVVAHVRDAAEATGARPVDVAVLAVGDRHVPAVTLESADPGWYMKHRLRDFLSRIGYLEPDGLGFVELVDEDGRFAWSVGRWENGGMVHPRPDLDQCSPITHSQPVGAMPPPCPAR